MFGQALFLKVYESIRICPNLLHQYRDGFPVLVLHKLWTTLFRNWNLERHPTYPASLDLKSSNPLHKVEPQDLDFLFQSAVYGTLSDGSHKKKTIQKGKKGLPEEDGGES